MTQPSVVAVLLAHDSGDVIAAALDAVAAQTSAVAATVVVDNGSRDGTPARVAARTDVSELVALDHNAGVGAGHNRGWEAALRLVPSAEFVWALEHDTIPEPKCLAGLLATFARQRANGVNVAAVVPRQLGAGQTNDRTDVQVHDALTFNGVLLAVSALHAVGPVREDFFIAQEDRELALRLVRAGYTIVKDWSVAVAHRNRDQPSSRRDLSRAYYSARNQVYLSVHIRRERLARSRAVVRSAAALVRTMLRDDQKWRRIRVRAIATNDGLRGRLGVRNL